MQNQPKFRVARPTNRLEDMVEFYQSGLGFEVLDRYDNQQGWDGVIMGHKDWPYQFEFSHYRDNSIVPIAPTMDHVRVFCINEEAQWAERLKALFDAGYTQVTPPQLYADENAACYEDPDGYRVVLLKGKWKK